MRAKAAKAKSASAQKLSAASVKTTRIKVTIAATISGTRKTRFADSQLTRRQASSGPIPVKTTSRIASGVV